MIVPKRLGWGPWVFVAMFAVVLGANGVMVWIAFDTWTGLETRNAYERGLAYNRVLDAERAQAALGWHVEVDVTPGEAGRATIDARFRNRDGHPVSLTRVRARLIRPTHSGHDTAVTLAKQGPGHYRTDLTVPLPGQWDLRVLAEYAGGTFQARRRVVLD